MDVRFRPLHSHNQFVAAGGEVFVADALGVTDIAEANRLSDRIAIAAAG